MNITIPSMNCVKIYTGETSTFVIGFIAGVLFITFMFFVSVWRGNK